MIPSKRINFPLILLENDAAYLEYIESLVRSLDEDADILISRQDDGIVFHITPTNKGVRQQIIDAVLGAHRTLSLRIIFSKSLKIQRKVSFFVQFLDETDNPPIFA